MEGNKMVNYAWDGKLLNFLLYCYWELDSKNISLDNSEIIKKNCARRAYLDLARTVKFQYSTSKLSNMKKRIALPEENNTAKEYEIRKEELIEKICENILSPVNGQYCTDTQFNVWHPETCNYLINEMNNGCILKDSKSFTYGQAQKWVNMTLKYLWLLDMLPNELSENSLHVPIDSFILQALENEGVGEVKRFEDYYKYKGDTWSVLDDYKKYMELQEAIQKIAEQKHSTPIAWEGPAWIAVAQKRKNK